MAYFPMFVDLQNKACLIIGGGRVAWHKILVLWDFGADITVVAKKVDSDIRQFATEHKICIKEKVFEEKDVEGMFLCVAATNNKELNHQISDICREKGVFINAVDQIEDCGFIFSSYIKEKDVVAAFSSSGNSPVVTQYLKAQMRDFVTPFLGEVTEYLGEIRPIVKEMIDKESERKEIYKKILELALEEKQLPQNDYVKKLLAEWRMKNE